MPAAALRAHALRVRGLRLRAQCVYVLLIVLAEMS